MQTAILLTPNREPYFQQSNSKRPLSASYSIDYGYANDQLTQIGVPILHSMGFNGTGVMLELF